MSDQPARNASSTRGAGRMSSRDTDPCVDGLGAIGGDRVLRVLMAKVGLDGHDRGLRVVTRILRDAGFEVVYAGLRQSPETIAAISAQEDVDVVGVSMHNGAHLTLAPAVVSALRSAGLDTPVVVGGIVPEADVEVLRLQGVAAVLGPGASNEEVIATMAFATGSQQRSSC
jgi:methylmalonyl-CoA mutase cobalamin-binding domain/chain